MNSTGLRRGRKRRHNRKPDSKMIPGGINTASNVRTKPIVTVAEPTNTLAALVIGALPSKPCIAGPD